MRSEWTREGEGFRLEIDIITAVVEPSGQWQIGVLGAAGKRGASGNAEAGVEAVEHHLTQLYHALTDRSKS